MRIVESVYRKAFIGTAVFIMVIMNSLPCSGYVMPAEQVLDFMNKNFSQFKTLVLVQSTLQVREGSERVFKEQVIIKSPDLFSIKPLDRLGERSEKVDLSYRQLIISNSTYRLENLLINMGIDIDKTALARYNDTIVYRIGEEGQECPKLLVEKERFLPLLLEYRPSESPDDHLIRVEFREYRKEEKGWYPYEIIFTANDTKEDYSLQTIQTNTEIDSTGLEGFALNGEPQIPEKYSPWITDHNPEKDVTGSFDDNPR